MQRSESMDAAPTQVRKSGVRIVILLADWEVQKKVAVGAAAEGMTSGWAWILIEKPLEALAQIQAASIDSLCCMFVATEHISYNKLVITY